MIVTSWCEIAKGSKKLVLCWTIWPVLTSDGSTARGPWFFRHCRRILHLTVTLGTLIADLLGTICDIASHFYNLTITARSLTFFALSLTLLGIRRWVFPRNATPINMLPAAAFPRCLSPLLAHASGFSHEINCHQFVAGGGGFALSLTHLLDRGSLP